MKFLAPFTLLLTVSGLHAQSLQWAGKLGGSGSTYATAVAVDAAGNTLTTGWFSNTAHFDPVPGVANLTVAVGGNYDSHVTKLDPMGHAKVAVCRSQGTSQNGGPLRQFTVKSADRDPLS